MENKKIVVYFHNDSDGVVSAAIVKKYYKDDDVTCIKCPYDNVPEITAGYDMYIVVDFSFPCQIMDRLQEDYGMKFIWIDHHISAKEKNPVLWKDANGLRSLDRCGCALTWQHYFPDENEPEVVTYVEDLDLWKWEWKDSSKPFNQVFYMRHSTPDDKVIEMLDDDNPDEIVTKYIEDGNVMLEMQDSQVQASFHQGKNIEWEGHRTRIINTNHNGSQVGEYCYNNNEIPIALMWHMKGDKVIVALRSNTVDVGAIATKHEGGGHRLASGFTTTMEAVLEWYKEIR